MALVAYSRVLQVHFQSMQADCKVREMVHRRGITHLISMPGTGVCCAGSRSPVIFIQERLSAAWRLRKCAQRRRPVPCQGISGAAGGALAPLRFIPPRVCACSRHGAAAWMLCEQHGLCAGAQHGVHLCSPSQNNTLRGKTSCTVISHAAAQHERQALEEPRSQMAERFAARHAVLAESCQ